MVVSSSSLQKMLRLSFMLILSSALALSALRSDISRMMNASPTFDVQLRLLSGRVIFLGFDPGEHLPRGGKVLLTPAFPFEHPWRLFRQKVFKATGIPEAVQIFAGPNGVVLTPQSRESAQKFGECLIAAARKQQFWEDSQRFLRKEKLRRARRAGQQDTSSSRIGGHAHAHAAADDLSVRRAGSATAITMPAPEPHARPTLEFSLLLDVGLLWHTLRNGDGGRNTFSSTDKTGGKLEALEAVVQLQNVVGVDRLGGSHDDFLQLHHEDHQPAPPGGSTGTIVADALLAALGDYWRQVRMRAAEVLGEFFCSGDESRDGETDGLRVYVLESLLDLVRPSSVANTATREAALRALCELAKRSLSRSPTRSSIFCGKARAAAVDTLLAVVVGHVGGGGVVRAGAGPERFDNVPDEANDLAGQAWQVRIQALEAIALLAEVEDGNRVADILGNGLRLELDGRFGEEPEERRLEQEGPSRTEEGLERRVNRCQRQAEEGFFLWLLESAQEQAAPHRAQEGGGPDTALSSAVRRMRGRGLRPVSLRESRVPWMN